MSLHDAKLGDVYRDESGKLWQVTALCGEPTVTVTRLTTEPTDEPVRQGGGVSGYMWHGFVKLEPRGE